jgi:lysophospholipase L1-like esterase/uncharacterized protein YxeA
MYKLSKKIWVPQLLLFSTLALYSQPTRIMPLGDSITHGYPHGYRSYLWYKLSDASYSANFVGSQHDGYGYGFDVDHEGYGGFKTYELSGIVYGLLQDNQPDIILLHIGSNDVSPTQGVDSDSVEGLEDILNQIQHYENDYNHQIRVVLAAIINRREYHDTVRYYNRNLRNLANSRIALGDKITLVDMEYDAGLNAGDYGDATHPDNSGYYKMSNVWFDALKGLLPPPVPDNINIANITYNSALLSWEDMSNKENGYKIYRNNTHIATVGSNVTSYALANLTAETHYNYKVIAYNANGETESDSIGFTTLQIPIPTEPNNFITSSIDTTKTTLSWNDTSTNETGFKIYQDNILIATLPSNTTSYQVTNLESRETYNFTIKAYNANGESSPIVLTVTTKDDYGWLIPIYHAILN